MEGTLVAMQVVALGALTVLSVYLIAVLIRVRSILIIVEKDIKELSARAIPVLENIEAITEKVKNVTESIDEQVETFKHSINSIKEIAENIASFERRVQDKIEGPVLDTVGTIAALFKGVQAFFVRIRA